MIQCERRLQLSRVKNVNDVFELSGLAFRLSHLMMGFFLVDMIWRAVGILRNATPFKHNKKPSNWLGQAKRRATEIRPHAIGGILNSYNSEPEVASDVIFGVVID